MLGFNRQSRRVQGVSRKEELTFELRSPSGLDETEVKLFVRSVDFVAHDRDDQWKRGALGFGACGPCVESHGLD